MGFLDDVSASLNRGVNAVGRSGKAAQIKLQMSELLKQRKDMAAQLGASLYDVTKDNPELRAGREALYDGIAKIDADRAKELIKSGAQPTDTVRALLKKVEVL